MNAPIFKGKNKIHLMYRDTDTTYVSHIHKSYCEDIVLRENELRKRSIDSIPSVRICESCLIDKHIVKWNNNHEY